MLNQTAWPLQTQQSSHLAVTIHRMQMCSVPTGTFRRDTGTLYKNILIGYILILYNCMTQRIFFMLLLTVLNSPNECFPGTFDLSPDGALSAR